MEVIAMRATTKRTIRKKINAMDWAELNKFTKAREEFVHQFVPTMNLVDDRGVAIRQAIELEVAMYELATAYERLSKIANFMAHGQARGLIRDVLDR
jgi:hypothetical protein